jgi:hypothetical protein
MVCNQPFPTLGAHSQNFKTNKIIVANKTSHDLITFQIYMHVIVHLKKCPSEKVAIVVVSITIFVSTRSPNALQGGMHHQHQQH